MKEAERKLIAEKAMGIASGKIDFLMTDKDFEHLPDEERAVAVIETVALASMISLSTLVEIFGEPMVDAVMSALNEEMEDAECEGCNCGECNCGECQGDKPEMPTDINTDMDEER